MRIYTVIHKEYGLVCSFKTKEDADNYIEKSGNPYAYRVKINILY